ncbi:uncharacterized protein A4U43_C06F3380 [Asparagus officinalis]|uniref:DYW domain-containing protein n=1 Tax=Asparagus officinalis TaxID=4686 RepID=A0A5P1EJV1_ASPOF|nr:pentatricopeptide repeat-containing protein At1g19720 [Asparagus officinalis]ONK66023.1 uncharacterized protein A4U43_C06F3380 [Asparagus officinalis]
MENLLLPLKPKTQFPTPIPAFIKPQPTTPSSKPITSFAQNPKHLASHNRPISKSTHLSHNATLQEAISALENGTQIRPKTYISLLQSCIDSDAIDEGRRLHSSIGSVTEQNPFVETKLVSMYAKCGCLDEARKVFDGMRERNLYTWSAMIGGYSREQRWEEVVDLFFEMMREEAVPDSFLLPKILQACSNVGDVETGRLLHSVAVRSGFLDSSVATHVSNSILAMYAKCGELELAKKFFGRLETKNRVSWNAIISGHCQFGENEEALRLFEQMVDENVEPGLVTWNILIASYNQAMELMEKMERAGVSPDVVSWTSMISGFVQNNKSSQALDLFQEMILCEVKPNAMTIASVMSACADLRSLKKGKEIHSYAIKIGSVTNVLVLNALVDMYGKCGRLEDAERLFDTISEKDVYTWNSMIGGYTLAGYCGKAFELFLKMETLGVRRNVVTWNVMMSGYIQNGDEEQAMELFQRMERDGIRRNTASWNTLISGSLQNGNLDNALSIFRQMQSNRERPNSITILGILPAFANLLSTLKIKELHASIFHTDLQSDTSITNALINAYSNAGDIRLAYAVFNNLQSKDLISWNSMISGCVLNGSTHPAWDLFLQMKEQGVKPNQATLTSVIRAYSLDKMVKEGIQLFSSMMEEYQLTPSSENYREMVELFGRSGRLGEASELIENMQIEPDSAVWNALLTAARIHGNFKVASLAAKHLIRLEPNNTRFQRLLSYLQTFIVKDGDLSKELKPKSENSTSVSCDCCWIEVKNKIHTFSTGDKPTAEMEPKLDEFNGMAEEIKTSMMPGFLGSKLDIEGLEDNGAIHGEKLAVAFSLINTPRLRTIKIIKSVKMCTECHNIVKLVSKVYRREILLKDPACLHFFKDGNCSCRDYW